MREGTRVASIETGLAAAAAKLSQQVRRGPSLGSGSPDVSVPTLMPGPPRLGLSQALGHLSIANPCSSRLPSPC